MYSLDVGSFSLRDTLCCGQCFLWEPQPDGAFLGRIAGRTVRLSQTGAALSCEGDLPADALRHYLGLDTDYAAIQAVLCRNPVLRAAVGYAPGIRILKQPLWEALVCFILSQNNNIKRITGIVQRLCAGFGCPDADGAGFPAPECLAALEPEDLAVLRCGFRAKYLVDAARRFSAGEIDETFLRTAPLGEARAMLERIRGVGPKVADCVLLFGAERYDAFPQDVWIKRALAQYFPQGLPRYLWPYAGIAQQYLFHYIRTGGGESCPCAAVSQQKA